MPIVTGCNRPLAIAVLGSLCAALAIPTFAQEAPPSAPAELTEVVVTGSRIQQPNIQAISPVQSVNQQEFQRQGTVNVESLLNNLPAVSPSQTQFTNGNGPTSTGIATVDLRNFGPSRTLVLVDGRRMPPGDAQQPVADLNLIPSSLVERVDVLTGGAASIYGSDAISGVVNFIMKHDFQGVQVDAQYGFSQHNNNNAAAEANLRDASLAVPTGSTIQGRNTHVTLTFGANLADNKGNVEGYLSYIKLHPVLQSAYDTESCPYASNFNDAGTAISHFCLGSSNSAYGNWQGNFFGDEDAAGNWVSSNVRNPAIQTLSNNPSGTNFVDYYNNTPPGAPSRAYNYAHLQYLQREDTRYQGGFFGHYTVNEHAEAYADLMYVHDTSTAQLAPSGLFRDNGPINQINCANPLATAAQQQALCGPNAGDPAQLSDFIAIGYRLQNSPRDYLLDHNAFKMDAGVRGSINDAWTYDVYVQYGRADSYQKTTHAVSLSKTANALNAIPDGNGGAMCADPAARAAGCVPLDIFQPLSAGITPDQLAYVQEAGIISGYTTEEVSSANLVGKLGNYGIKSPWAANGLAVALGAEYRRDYLNVSPDAITNSGDLGVGGVPSVSGSTDVKEAYAELSVPIVSDRFLVKDLSFDGSYRWSDYALSGSTGTYKLGLGWAVTGDVRFRSAYARTERAPGVTELFSPQSIGGQGFIDPCAGANPSYSAEACYRSSNLAAAGVTEAQFESTIYGRIADCPAGACNVKLGGNPGLKPEVARTITAGFILTPWFAPGLQASIDYWDINILNAVGTLSPSSIMQGCYADDNTELCNSISRNPLNGSLTGTSGFVSVVNQNLTGQHQRGVDFQADYHFPLSGWGSIDTNINGSLLLLNRTAVPAEGTYDCKGLYGPTCGTPRPNWRHTLRSTWVTPWNVDVSLQWRFLEHVNADLNSSNPILSGGCCSLVDAKIPTYSYFDFSAAWRVLDNVTMHAGINNILDKDPPALDTVFLGLASAPTNSWPSVYDPLGRTVFISVTARF